MDQPSPSPSLLDRSAIAPALVGLVVGIVAGVLMSNVLAGVAIGVVLAFSAVMRRYAAAKMEARYEQQAREHERRR